jgi:hypothetical protein
VDDSPVNSYLYSFKNRKELIQPVLCLIFAIFISKVSDREEIDFGNSVMNFLISL